MEIKNNKFVISTIIVILAVLVTYSYKGDMTGQATLNKNTRTIDAPNIVNGGDSIKIAFTPKLGADLINIGGSYKETLWLKGPSVTKPVSNMECVNGYTGKCKKVQTKAAVWFSPTWEKGSYYLTVEKTTYEGREILAKKTITLR